MLSLPRPGDVLGGKYVLRERLGEGGMGTVFLADQPALARTVAIKLLHPRHAANHELASLFREEAVAASRVRHPNSVAVIDCSIADGLPYIVMENVGGRSLGRIIVEEHVPMARAVDLVLQILAALEAAHASGVVHADVKSDNFLVAQQGAVEHVTLIDFGLARIDGQQLKLHGERGERVVSGTPEYMAPETIRGKPVTAAADLYAVGVILYELLTGVTPFTGATTSEIMTHQVHDLVVPPSLRRADREIPTGLDEIVLRALHKLPEARYASASAFATALRGVSRLRDYGLARRDRCDDAARADAITRCSLAVPRRRRLARGSDCDGVRQDRRFGEQRRAIASALSAGNLDQIADGYTRLAAALRAERCVTAAAAELEEGIDVLAGLGGAFASVFIRRLVRTLAELQDHARTAG